MGERGYAYERLDQADGAPMSSSTSTLRNRNGNGGHRLGFEMSERGLTREAPPAPYNLPPVASQHGPAAGARYGPEENDTGGELADDEAVARALQDEYDREHSDLRQQQGQQQQQANYDYRTAGYANPHASSMPSTVPASCTMCRGLTPVPYAPGRLQFRCDRCGFLNSCTIPRGRAAFGDDLYYDRYGMPIICSIQ